MRLSIKSRLATRARRYRNGEAPKPVEIKIDPTIDMKTPPKVQVDTMPAGKYFILAAEIMKLQQTSRHLLEHQASNKKLRLQCTGELHTCLPDASEAGRCDGSLLSPSSNATDLPYALDDSGPE